MITSRCLLSFPHSKDQQFNLSISAVATDCTGDLKGTDSASWRYEQTEHLRFTIHRWERSQKQARLSLEHSGDVLSAWVQMKAENCSKVIGVLTFLDSSFLARRYVLDGTTNCA